MPGTSRFFSLNSVFIFSIHNLYYLYIPPATSVLVWNALPPLLQNVLWHGTPDPLRCRCGPSFGAGDVVGCGLDYSVGGDAADIFFTLNGELLNGGSAAFRGVRGTFYPTVGVDSACPVQINLGGEPFRFDLAAALREGGQEATAREVSGVD